MFVSSCSKERVQLILPENPTEQTQFAADHLAEALAANGYELTDAEADYTIALALDTEADLKKEGFRLTCADKAISITGKDVGGLLYGCREVIDRMEAAGELSVPEEMEDAPEMVLRGTCIGVQKTYYLPGRTVYEYPYTPENFPWFYDKELWVKYLDMLVENRMNSVYLWNGHPFASLVKLEDYPFAIEVDDETFRKNQEIYGFITQEASKRGIFVIQMFYNILVSKPFAEHYGIRTQDRNRPISPLLSDYTRKSIAAFVETYPNVGLLVCLGEAMATYEDDVEWFTKTVLPGVKDGLKALGRTDEPPVLLRAHDTNCRMVMDAALPIYKNLYTMHKYNGESLTTYTPGGPWGDIHKDLSSLGSTHISNVHVLANLEPFRWASPDFTQKTVQAMHDVHGANALHLYPQASYWDWPYTADKVADGSRLEQLDRDWAWYKAWGRYAWNCRRDRTEEMAFWDKTYGEFFGMSAEDAASVREAYEEMGEIAPKTLRRFGITEGNRQTLLLGMFMSQLVNPYKYTIYPGFYESCGPAGEKLIEWVEKEWKGQPHVENGEFPLDIVEQCIAHGDAAVEAIESVKAKKNVEEFARLKNDVRCYRAFAYAFYWKVKAAQQVLNYQWSKDLNYLDEAIPLLEKSLAYYRELADLTKDTYHYANSMQTAQRRIPISGGEGKNKTWVEMVPHYEAELAALKANTELLKSGGKSEIEVVEAKDAAVKLQGAWRRVKMQEGVSPFSNNPALKIEAIAPELEGLTGFVFDGELKRTEATTFSFSCEKPVTLLVGYFKGDNKRFAPAPKLETDATANDYNQAEPLLQNAVKVKDWALANVHPYRFAAGEHTVTLPRGYLLVLGFTDTELKSRNVGLAGSDDAIDWLFY
ncbi:MAG: glycoside hydrolase family 20 zincin-like fold domain-containing protein [Rikenellaceae bacterium]|nr:glycoside hydrolase family 20 zincin-like fold domain-containing protein [Rikenellaceae bacterium]